MRTGSRRQGRELALKIIYSFHDQPQAWEEIRERFWTNFQFRNDVLGDATDRMDEPVPAEVRRFADRLAQGVAENLDRIDRTISGFSTNWALERMARVDLALLRLGAFELLFCPEVPASVIINEAIEVGKRYGTSETPAFVNGILDQISRTCRSSSK
jgi:N utilization substance protein B